MYRKKKRKPEKEKKKSKEIIATLTGQRLNDFQRHLAPSRNREFEIITSVSFQVFVILHQLTMAYPPIDLPSLSPLEATKICMIEFLGSSFHLGAN